VRKQRIHSDVYKRSEIKSSSCRRGVDAELIKKSWTDKRFYLSDHPLKSACSLDTLMYVFTKFFISFLEYMISVCSIG